VISPQGGYDDDVVILFSNYRSQKKNLKFAVRIVQIPFLNAFFFGKKLPNFQNHKTEKKKEKKGAKKEKNTSVNG
jgi:hypothetical protein